MAAAAAPVDISSVSNGDVYKCSFVNLPVVFSLPLSPNPAGGYMGGFQINGSATCAFADANDSGAPTTFNATILSYGATQSFDQCGLESVQFTGDTSHGPTTISGGPEGTITGQGSDLYDIEVDGAAGVIDMGSGLTEPDGDQIHTAHIAGQFAAIPGNRLLDCGVIFPRNFAFALTGSVTFHT